MPGELTASLEVLAEEGEVVQARSQNPLAAEFLVRVEILAKSLHRWLYKRERTGAVLNNLSELSRHFAEFESLK